MFSKFGTFGRKDAADYIKVSLPTLDSFLNRAENPMPSFHAGRKVLIPCAALEAWLADEARRQQEGFNSADVRSVRAKEAK